MGIDAERKKKRDARMDELVTLTKSWSKSTQAQYTARVEMLKRLVKGRSTGRVTQTTVEAASSLVVDEIDAFLTG